MRRLAAALLFLFLAGCAASSASMLAAIDNTYRPPLPEGIWERREEPPHRPRLFWDREMDTWFDTGGQSPSYRI